MLLSLCDGHAFQPTKMIANWCNHYHDHVFRKWSRSFCVRDHTALSTTIMKNSFLYQYHFIDRLTTHMGLTGSSDSKFWASPGCPVGLNRKGGHSGTPSDHWLPLEMSPEEVHVLSIIIQIGFRRIIRKNHIRGIRRICWRHNSFAKFEQWANEMAFIRAFTHF